MFTLKSTPASKRKAAEREPFIEIDGVTYEVDKAFATNFALQYVAMTTERSVDAANVWLMKQALGDVGYTAIISFPDLKPEDLGGIIGGLVERVYTALEPGKSEPSGS